MLSQIKLWAIGALSVISAILFGVFKYQRHELKEQEKEIETLREKEKIAEIVKSKTEEVAVESDKEEQEIEERYDAKQKETIESVSDRPLSPAILRMLNSRYKDGTYPPPE